MRGGEERQGRGGKNGRKEEIKRRESDDQVLVGLVRDAHICSKSSVVFAYSPYSLSVPTMAEGMKRRRRQREDRDVIMNKKRREVREK